MEFPLRQDNFGLWLYIEKGGETFEHPLTFGSFSFCGIDFSAAKTTESGILALEITYSAKKETKTDKLGLRLGIDCYMEKYPEWNDKFFPTALRCEKNGFWSCFMSPAGKMLAVCSPDKTVSWKNEYNTAFYNGVPEVGHRIYTSAVEFINTYPQPPRHPKSETSVEEKRTHRIYYSFVKNETELKSFIKKYSGIILPDIEKYTYGECESAVICGKEYSLADGVNTFNLPATAEITLYKRKEWFYYLERAAKSAEKCQQKSGSHCESWYGFFTLCLYAKELCNTEYTKNLCERFDKFFGVMTEDTPLGMRFKYHALPSRLQNLSSMVSLLADFYELTKNEKYLTFALNIADSLLETQNEQGAFICDNTHYTCVIYPAKSLLELCITLKNAGKNADKYFLSAKKAMADVLARKDNIGTEGEQTFEDGMISCAALQLAFYALNCSDKEKAEYIKAAAGLYKKHACLEQRFLPDCRMRGATLRFWEARYDLNFFANMLNTPHGWTSWKNYASYYLYLLTGEFSYLADLFDTLGACVQCVDSSGELNWGFVGDPCVTGFRLKKGATRENYSFETVTVGETYLPMISDWYKQRDTDLILQYIFNPADKERTLSEFGGSCDNDVHEHFKCLHETVFAKAFIHEGDDKTHCFNCKCESGEYRATEQIIREIVYFAKEKTAFIFGGKEYKAEKGINIIKI